MIKHLLILSIAGILVSNNCAAQIKKKFITSEKAVVTPPPPPSSHSGKTSKPKPKPIGLVRLTTNEDCKLKINNNEYSIKKGETRSISLPVGIHKLVATNTFNFDELTADLNVKGGQSSFLIDLTRIQEVRNEKLNSLENMKSKSDEYSNTENNRTKETVKSEPPAINKDKEEKDKKETAIVNELLSGMVTISSGGFKMGSDVGKNDESPEHIVMIRQVKFGKYEVTQKQWETVMGYNPSNNSGCDKCPVENVSWEEVNTFLDKINQAGNKKFRLPTEAEWEYIAEMGGGSKELKAIAWFDNNSGGKTHPVGTLSANAFGIFDLFGNVSEWCGDWYSFNYYKNKTEDNPAGPASGKEKIVRGGSFDDMGGAFRPSYRDKLQPNAKRKTLGFRLVMEEN